ncbi:MAG: hypothetical protein Q8L60_14040 [Gammaproteobacteria bacterium]|nr:hypothetical protein [Gammaproteobacteria bacterium]MDP2142132.1 hypothetical protein [Gammaproteobacteria bacterium]MDP2348260.1 hypothetical protein [Gammaproteobacteria bacterium]
MRKTTIGLLAGFCLLGSVTVQAADMGGIIKAQVILGQITQIANKYQDVQDLLNAGTIELEIPEPIEGNTGEFFFPYDQSGYLTAWADKALNAQVGAEVGGRAADGAINSLASRVPLGGFLAGAAKSKAKETGAVIAIGGWDFIRENTDTSFDSLADLSVYMHSRFNGEADYEKALAAAMALYPELERGHERAVDNAYREARRRARDL